MSHKSRTRLDRNLLHEYFWKRSDRHGKIRVNQSELADALALDRTTLVRIMREFEITGRARKLSEGWRRESLYQVVDPSIWKDPSAT